jgi:hypothetical protein
MVRYGVRCVTVIETFFIEYPIKNKGWYNCEKLSTPFFDRYKSDCSFAEPEPPDMGDEYLPFVM